MAVFGYENQNHSVKKMCTEQLLFSDEFPAAPPLLEASAMLHSTERERRSTQQTDTKTQVSWSEFIRS